VTLPEPEAIATAVFSARIMSDTDSGPDANAIHFVQVNNRSSNSFRLIPWNWATSRTIAASVPTRRGSCFGIVM